jgi:hypothetical protein
MIILFQNVRQAINTEFGLRNLKIEIKVISVPRSISSECGVAIELFCYTKEQIETVLLENNLVGKIYDGEYKK